MKATQLLHNLGQSIWLDNITRDLLDTGTTFGASAPLKALQKKFGFEPDRVVLTARELLGRG
jgi:transketolase